MKEKNESLLSKFGLSSERYQLLFGFDNMIAVFRAKESLKAMPKIHSDSRNYDIIYSRGLGDIMPNDALVDILYSARSGELELCASDVVCIKLNGAFVNHCFIGPPCDRCSALDAGAMFDKVDNFVEEERDSYVSDLHETNNVLNIFDGTIIPLKNCGIGRQFFYCIDKEVFYNHNEKIFSEYCLYSMDCTGNEGIVIKNINPFPKPFNSVKTAFYYFDKCHDKRKSAVLLLNRQEIEMVKDYVQLRNVI